MRHRRGKGHEELYRDRSRFGTLRRPGKTFKETEHLLHEAIGICIARMHADENDVLEPSSVVDYLEVKVGDIGISKEPPVSRQVDPLLATPGGDSEVLSIQQSATNPAEGGIDTIQTPPPSRLPWVDGNVDFFIASLLFALALFEVFTPRVGFIGFSGYFPWDAVRDSLLIVVLASGFGFAVGAVRFGRQGLCWFSVFLAVIFAIGLAIIGLDLVRTVRFIRSMHVPLNFG